MQRQEALRTGRDRHRQQGVGAAVLNMLHVLGCASERVGGNCQMAASPSLVAYGNAVSRRQCMFGWAVMSIRLWPFVGYFLLCSVTS